MNLKLYPIEQLARVLRSLNPTKKDRVYLTVDAGDDLCVYLVNSNLTLAVTISDKPFVYESSYSNKTFELDPDSLINIKIKELCNYELLLDFSSQFTLFLIDSTTGSIVAEYPPAKYIDTLELNLSDITGEHRQYTVTNHQISFLLNLIKTSKHHPVIGACNKLCIPNQDFTQVEFFHYSNDKVYIIYYPHLVYKYLYSFFKGKHSVNVPILYNEILLDVTRVGPFEFQNSYVTIQIEYNEVQATFNVKDLINRLYSITYHYDVTQESDTNYEISDEYHIGKYTRDTEYGPVDVFESIPYVVKGQAYTTTQTLDKTGMILNND